MAADSISPETDVRTRPNPEDESSPSTAPVAPAIAASVIMIEPPAPEALPPPPPVVEPGVPEPRPDEATRVEIVTAPKTSEERAWGLGFFALVTLVFTLATLAALAWNWSYVVRLSGLPAALQSWAWPPFPFPPAHGALGSDCVRPGARRGSHWVDRDDPRPHGTFHVRVDRGRLARRNQRVRPVLTPLPDAGQTVPLPMGGRRAESSPSSKSA